MGAIHARIKKIREVSGNTQADMAEMLNIHIKTWQKIENGITRIDLERLQQISKILEIPIEDFLNTEDNVYIGEIKNNRVGFNNATVTINETSETESSLLKKLLVEKDRVIEIQSKYIVELEEKLNQK
ncbi:hypothetical protein KO02_01515 [Sphingobacterium sp. ML3W]|uniref:helix-turn-helix domain-containing protein n=1 Tax=Sphingobacterium sp. ML3W TaxID=1538644 RepID=UPI0004F7CB6F|nr:helix-turn-helix transcriptional regulator [Sphingobacterium sp. ML3W]AIM35483.1 hypothetical protein KO02_01515 [Sphingobacterium sp. ML3W]